MNPSDTQPPRIVRAPPTDRPVLIFDGDCNFCRRWIARWQRGTGDRVTFAEFQKVGAQFPEISSTEFEQGVQFIDLDGTVLSGADAVFRLADFARERGRLARALRRTRGFMPIARAAYRLVAANRLFFSRFS